MTLARGRVLRAEGVTSVVAVARAAAPHVPGSSPSRPRRVSAEVVRAHEEAAEIVRRARERATQLLAAATRDAAGERLRAEELGRADGLTRAAALAARYEEAAARADEASLDRVVTLATVLAERLLGHVLRVAPEEITALARNVVAEARGARRMELFAHPGALDTLRAAIADLDEDQRVASVNADPALGPGDLRLETDLGSVEAPLAPSLSKLAERLRDVLRR